ncbi:6478_t:CDS:2 [Ambispora gerdemannii]|uniref:6478_t:CDS:1 n=1 Tax=Ambispora gerdemannii TaxID=144530 RepID=A0A9N9D6U4_9GLOM|nr:6478_t:CDS:2 [Ambispora gerdemannii]
MAGTWALNQLRYTGIGYESRREFDKGTKKIATPVGLLPYGEKVKVSYKGNLCKECKEKETEQKESVVYKYGSTSVEGGGLYERKVEVKQGNETIELTLLGTKSTMELIKEDKFLAMPRKYTFKSLKPFGLLLRDGEKKEHDSSIYHRLGLVELGAGSEKLKENVKSIAIPNQVQIEIPPKQN